MNGRLNEVLVFCSFCLCALGAFAHAYLSHSHYTIYMEDQQTLIKRFQK